MGDIYQRMLDAFGYGFEVDMRDEMKDAVRVLLKDMQEVFRGEPAEQVLVKVYARHIGIELEE